MLVPDIFSNWSIHQRYILKLNYYQPALLKRSLVVEGDEGAVVVCLHVGLELALVLGGRDLPEQHGGHLVPARAALPVLVVLARHVSDVWRCPEWRVQ